jgi:PPOX class probable FMN-dependent enzyme
MQSIKDEAALRKIYPEPVDLVKRKMKAAIDGHARHFLELARLAFLSTSGGDGSCDVSPRGDRRGFMRVLSPTRIAMPDWPGNNRIDSLRNIVANPKVGLLLVVPGYDDTLRINGRAFITDDVELLEAMRAERRAPRTAIVIDIEELYFHCGRAFRRSEAWNGASYPAPGTLPSLARILADQTQPDTTESAMLEDSGIAPLY